MFRTQKDKEEEKYFRWHDPKTLDMGRVREHQNRDASLWLTDLQIILSSYSWCKLICRSVNLLFKVGCNVKVLYSFKKNIKAITLISQTVCPCTDSSVYEFEWLHFSSLIFFSFSKTMAGGCFVVFLNPRFRPKSDCLSREQTNTRSLEHWTKLRIAITLGQSHCAIWTVPF